MNVKQDNLLFGALLALSAPLLGALVFLILWFFISKIESIALTVVCTGFAAGIVLDVFFLRAWIRQPFSAPVNVIIINYVIYSLMLYGFFMGFPVPMLILGPFAGYYMGKRCVLENSNQQLVRNRTRMVSAFTTAILAIFCLFTIVLIILSDAASELTGMLGIPDMPFGLVLACLICGSIILTFLQYIFTKFSHERTISRHLN